jgi:RNA polymerase sigma-70 factor (ECF subfamily)
LSAALFSDENVRFVMRTLLRLGAPPRDAEDLTQEVFVIAHRRASEFDATRLAAPWLFGITKNVLRDYRKLARNRYEVLDEARERPSAAVDDDVDLLRRAIAALPEELSDVVILCDLSGLTVLETASALGVPEGTLKDRLRRGRRDLKAEIDRRRQEATHA